ncbi:MAG: hypothetical protein SNJ57_06000 [Cyanobacteriota bacterium]
MLQSLSHKDFIQRRSHPFAEVRSPFWHQVDGASQDTSRQENPQFA